MRKIGIITYHFSVNYGAVLQSYALQRFLINQKVGVELIDYRPFQIRNSNIKYLYYRGQRLPNPLLFASGIQKWKKFKEFINSDISLSSETFLDNGKLSLFSERYSAVICGSDEVWNINDIHTDFGEDLSYFLDFVDANKTRKISYATSFGQTGQLGNKKSKISKLLGDFNAIGVRDSNSAQLVQECGQRCTKVLDPTFLVDYSDILKKPKVTANGYILLYGSFSKVQGSYIESVAKSEGLKVISIGARPGEWKPPISFLNVGPREWLGYFSDATYIFTNYFHGAIFSILFRKPFISFNRPEKSIKVKDLLGALSLEDRIITEAQISSLGNEFPSLTHWDEQKIAQLIHQSKSYLSDALELSSKMATY